MCWLFHGYTNPMTQGYSQSHPAGEETKLWNRQYFPRTTHGASGTHYTSRVILMTLSFPGGRGWESWIVSPAQWAWTWTNSRRQWRAGKPGMLPSLGSQRATYGLATEQQQQILMEIHGFRPRNDQVPWCHYRLKYEELDDFSFFFPTEHCFLLKYSGCTVLC